MGSILIIDDNIDVLEALTLLLEDEFSKVVTEKNVERLPFLLSTSNFDVILLDMNYSAGLNAGNEGLFWLKKILEKDPDAVVVMMTAYGNIHLAVEAMKLGAKEFVIKPWENEKLVATLKACFELRKAKKQVSSLKIRQKELTNSGQKFHFLRGKSEAMQRLQQEMEKIAATEASILILGENGTGKEMVARELHRLSNRSNEIFLSVDLSSLSSSIFESELFGHKKGSFTDAKADKMGRFEVASGGTLFLDEIGNLPLSLQTKILTALQNREITPLGGAHPVPIDVRVISATNAPIHTLVEKGEFRQDLLYRINTVTLTIPSLRERKEDIADLAAHFLKIYSTKYLKGDLKISETALEELRRYTWPGNVRELQHAIEKAVIMSDGNLIHNFEFSGIQLNQSSGSFQNKTLAEIEAEAIETAIRKNNGNVVKAAQDLGITRQTIYNKMKKYGF